MGRAILVAMPDTAHRAIFDQVDCTDPVEQDTRRTHLDKAFEEFAKKAIAPATETDAPTSTASPSRWSSDPAVNASTGSSAALRSMWVPPNLKRSTPRA